MAQKSPDIARFGAALPPLAEEVSADDSCARYGVEARLDDLHAFYQGIYGKARGMLVERMETPAPPTVAVVAGPQCQDVAFGMVLVRSAGKPDQPRAQEILVLARGEAAPPGYPDSSPWLTRKQK